MSPPGIFVTDGSCSDVMQVVEDSEEKSPVCATCVARSLSLSAPIILRVSGTPSFELSCHVLTAVRDSDMNGESYDP